ncbi:MAG TPA: TPM domain-containing protein [Ktedonobacteraceae bacterium]|nr:TPM domain-containing protein [Chthonomonadales bacterium]HEV2582134.1 TPM domain-containing protein [Ktedonobacteraceae bacterium]
MREPARIPVARRILMLLVLVLAWALAACAGQQSPPAGTATQDPPVPQLTQATHGIMDTTGTVPQSLLEQLRTRSDEVQAHGYQIAVVFFNNLASDPHQFATQVFNTNGIGSKDKNNGVLLVLYLQKPGTDGHAPWLSYITGGGISTALPDTLMDDYVQATYVPARAQGNWQDGLLAFYDKIYTAEQDPSIAQQWQSQHPQSPAATGPSNNLVQTIGILILVCLAIVFWLVVSAIVAARRRENFVYTAFRLLGRFLFVLVLLSRGMGGGSRSRSGGSGPWGGGGSSPSSGGDV